jgi:zinc transport system ATP-binding protein
MKTMATEAPVLLRCSALAVGYGNRALLPPIDLAIHAGEFWAVVGRNGSGKTTWLRTALGLLPPVRGRVIKEKNALRLSYVPQRSAFDELYPVRARDVVRMGTERGWSFAKPRAGEPDSVERALVEVDAKDLASRAFRSLSEGQKQRVLLARCVASDAEIAFLDEPTAAMDMIAERESLALLSALRKKHNMAIVVISHGLGLIREHADHALWMDRDSQSVVSGTIDEVFRRAALPTVDLEARDG